MSDRPYDENDVFAIEMITEDIARQLYARRGPWSIMDLQDFEALLYDAMVALREQLLDEEDL